MCRNIEYLGLDKRHVLEEEKVNECVLDMGDV